MVKLGSCRNWYYDGMTEYPIKILVCKVNRNIFGACLDFRSKTG